MNSKLDDDSYFGLKKWFWEQFLTIWHKNHHFMLLFGQMPLQSSIAMATPKVLNSIKKTAEGSKFAPPPPSKVGLIRNSFMRNLY